MTSHRVAAKVYALSEELSKTSSSAKRASRACLCAGKCNSITILEVSLTIISINIIIQCVLLIQKFGFIKRVDKG